MAFLQKKKKTIPSKTLQQTYMNFRERIIVMNYERSLWVTTLEIRGRISEKTTKENRG